MCDTKGHLFLDTSQQTTFPMSLYMEPIVPVLINLYASVSKWATAKDWLTRQFSAAVANLCNLLCPAEELCF